MIGTISRASRLLLTLTAVVHQLKRKIRHVFDSERIFAKTKIDLNVKYL